MDLFAFIEKTIFSTERESRRDYPSFVSPDTDVRLLFHDLSTGDYVAQEGWMKMGKVALAAD